MTKIDVWLSPDRGKIVNLISKNPKTISDLEKELKINRGTLKHHLKILKEHKIITRRKENHLSGKPVFIELVKDVKPPTVGEMSSKQFQESSFWLWWKKYGMHIEALLIIALFLILIFLYMTNNKLQKEISLNCGWGEEDYECYCEKSVARGIKNKLENKLYNLKIPNLENELD